MQLTAKQLHTVIVQSLRETRDARASNYCASTEPSDLALDEYGRNLAQYLMGEQEFIVVDEAAAAVVAGEPDDSIERAVHRALDAEDVLQHVERGPYATCESIARYSAAAFADQIAAERPKQPRSSCTDCGVEIAACDFLCIGCRWNRSYSEDAPRDNLGFDLGGEAG